MLIACVRRVVSSFCFPALSLQGARLCGIRSPSPTPTAAAHLSRRELDSDSSALSSPYSESSKPRHVIRCDRILGKSPRHVRQLFGVEPGRFMMFQRESKSAASHFCFYFMRSGRSVRFSLLPCGRLHVDTPHSRWPG